MAMIAQPLTTLTWKDKATGRIVIFEWSEDCEESF